MNEPAVINHQVNESYTGRFNFSQQNGGYSVSVLDTGTFTVVPSSLNYYNQLPVSHNAYFSGTHLTDSLNDFAFQSAGVYNDLCVQITPVSVFIPGFNA